MTTLPLIPTYPCVACGAVDRWQDAGIWRCRPCWPDPITLQTREMERQWQVQERAKAKPVFKTPPKRRGKAA